MIDSPDRYILLPIAALLVVLFGGAVFMWLIMVNLHQFLAKNASVASEVLVVEGWLPDYALKAAMVEFYTGGYKTLITLGTPLPTGFYLSEYQNFAQLSAATLIALGVNPQQIVVVSTSYSEQNRTQNMAIALKQYLVAAYTTPPSLNIFTLGPHARRTWLIFRSVFSPEVALGILATPSLSYESKGWWKSSEGFRAVVGELIAYLYQRLWG